MGDEMKHLVLVVELTSALAPYWTNIVETYLRKLIMAFCGDQNTNAAGPNVSLGLVEFNEIKSGLVQWSGRTKDVDSFFTWLLAIQFDGGGFCDVEIAEGLASALKHLPSPNEGQPQKNVGIQRHCILVAASNPPNESVTESKFCLSDAEKVASSFPLSLVSLSVICPKQLPKLISIYNVGKRNHLAADYTIDILGNPHYLVLIAESFIEACSDFSQSGRTTLPSNPSRNDDSQNLKLAVSGSTNKSILNKLAQAHRMNLTGVD
uniref:mediator of RNA polymerase II transcription subunit 25-like n=1 Tax=Erigeron canadensis TaxID=72917 RepID=UPI001CB921D4|nr:mediator of RNA polymerase II transcription subunit 25-like [Erigeron canadensis]